MNVIPPSRYRKSRNLSRSPWVARNSSALTAPSVVPSASATSRYAIPSIRDRSRAARCFGGSAATAVSSARASSRPAAPCSGSMASGSGSARFARRSPPPPPRLPKVDPQLALGSPELVQAEVGGDGEHPRRQLALRPVALPKPEHLDEHVLRDLLGPRLAAHQPAHVLQDA